MTLQYKQVQLLLDDPGGYNSITSFSHDEEVIRGLFLPSWLLFKEVIKVPFLEAGCIEFLDAFIVTFPAFIASITYPGEEQAAIKY